MTESGTNRGRRLGTVNAPDEPELLCRGFVVCGRRSRLRLGQRFALGRRSVVRCWVACRLLLPLARQRRLGGDRRRARQYDHGQLGDAPRRPEPHRLHRLRPRPTRATPAVRSTYHAPITPTMEAGDGVEASLGAAVRSGSPRLAGRRAGDFRRPPALNLRGGWLGRCAVRFDGPERSAPRGERGAARIRPGRGWRRRSRRAGRCDAAAAANRRCCGRRWSALCRGR